MVKVLFLILFFLPTMAQEKFSMYVQNIAGSDQSFKMIPMQGGSFLIGSDSLEKGRDIDEGPSKKVVVSDFWMGETEVTYDIFQLFLDETKDPSPKADGITRPSQPYIDFTLGMGKQGNFPANSMQQYSALMFCKWLYKKTGIFYRLPTETEWEYTAKQSYTPSQMTDSTLIREYEWFAENAKEKYHQVASKKSNILGIYDLLGNVAEWTLDQYDDTFYDKISDGSKDPMAFKTKRYPVTVRGGSYKSTLRELRPSNRTKSDPLWNRRDPQMPKSKWWNADAPFIGLRLVRPLKDLTSKEVEQFFQSVLK